MEFTQARTDRHFAFIRAAQTETAALSYGRAFTSEEEVALSRRVAQAARVPTSRLTIVEQDGKILGYVWFDLRNGGVAFLLDLYVAPGQRRRRLAAILLQEAVRQGVRMGATELRAAVASRNVVARSFFAAQGLSIGETEIREGSIWYELVRKLNGANQTWQQSW